MASTPLPRRRPGAVPIAALTGLAALLALAALAVGRDTPGSLKDHGPARAVTPPPVSRPLWPGLAVSPPPSTPTATTTPAPPEPLPGLTVPGGDLTAVDVRTLLAKDPALSQEERRALDSCAGCDVRSPEFRDLTGDGRQSLITTVTTPGPVVLHVYTPDGDHVLPILRVQVQSGFSAATIGSDLWIYEPTSISSRTSSHYQWSGVRLVPVEQRVDGIGLLPPTGQPTEQPVAVPAPGRPAPVEKGPAPGAGVPSPRAGRPTSGPAAPAAPAATAVPSVPAVLPEAKR